MSQVTTGWSPSRLGSVRTSGPIGVTAPVLDSPAEVLSYELVGISPAPVDRLGGVGGELEGVVATTGTHHLVLDVGEGESVVPVSGWMQVLRRRARAGPRRGGLLREDQRRHSWEFDLSGESGERSWSSMEGVIPVWRGFLSRGPGGARTLPSGSTRTPPGTLQGRRGRPRSRPSRRGWRASRARTLRRTPGPRWSRPGSGRRGR